LYHDNVSLFVLK